MSFYVDITKRLGEKILAKYEVAHQEITHVDLTKDGDWAYSSWTPGYTNYDAIVHYFDGEGKAQSLTECYDSMSEILNLLIEIADEDGPPEPKTHQSTLTRVINYVAGR